MKKSLTLFFIFLAGSAWFFWFFRLPELSDIISPSPKIIKPAEKQIFSPPPLLSTLEKAKDKETTLREDEIIKWTNFQREEYGLEPLRENLKLKAMAEAKAKSMFEKQYFAHQSPLGEEVGDLAEYFDYQFLAIGENLAMGNFENEKLLLEAWMASQGHKENILNPSYQEIGIAAKKGVFEGKTTWLAVQHFGLPLSACPEPDEEIKLKIEEKTRELESRERLLSELFNEMQKIRPKRTSLYSQRQYNDLVREYNNLLEQKKILIEEYNLGVESFNQCLLELYEN